MTEPENPVETSGSPAASTESAPTTADTPTAAPRKRAPRKATSAKASKIADPGTAPAVGTASGEAPGETIDEIAKTEPAKKAPRKRAPRKATAPVVAVPADPADAAVVAPAADETTQAGTPATAEAAPPTRRRRATKAASAAPESRDDIVDSTSTEPSASSAEPVAPVTPPALAAGTVLFVAPSEVPETVPETRPRRRARAAQSPPPVPIDPSEEDALEALVDTDEVEGAESVEQVLDSEEAREIAAAEATGARRRRRRGRRGRGGRSGDSTDENDVESSTEESSDDEVSTDEGGEPDGDADDSDEAPLSASARRRRRRRRSSDGGDNAGTSDTDDPPNTVVHVRNSRSGAATAAAEDDGVRGVKGSTRLEAKRQRRREGRDTGRRRPPILTESEFLARRESVDRVMAVRDLGDRTQIAVLEDGILVEHYVTRASSTSYAGNIYLGRVQNVLPSMEAAFIDIGKARNGVLYAGEVNWDAAGMDGRSRAIEKALHSGDVVPVQVTKDPIGQKGARLTSQISLPGRFLVYVPNGGMTGISRKLPDVERSRLKSILKRIVPEDAGVIVRTAAEGASEADLTHDVERLKAQWESIKARTTSPKSAPALLYGEPDLAIRVVRDVFNEDFKQLVVQGDRAWQTISEYVNDVAPDLAERSSKYVGTGDLFSDLRVDEQLTKALDRKVFLPSGGSLVIDRTEAMTVVDVNTGKFVGSGGNLEETVTRNNLEAAEEIVRQLRLRDVGGIVVIDFIDMVLESNRDLVLRRLTECLGRDRTKHQVAEVTSLGLVQMTRKRVGEGLLEAFSETCEHCKGRGVIVHTDPVGISSAALESTDDGGSKKKSRRGRGKNGSAETYETPEPLAPPMSEEQRRAAAIAMAAMAAHVHGDVAVEADADASTLAGELAGGADDASIEIDPATPQVDGAAAAASTNGVLAHTAVDWVTDAVADLAPAGRPDDEPVNGAVYEYATRDSVTDGDDEPATEPALVPAAAPPRRPRRRAASRPAGPPAPVGQ